MAEITDVKRAVKALAGKQQPFNELWAYYDGNQPLRYSTERLRKIFKDIEARFTQNWCAVVVDAAQERMAFRQFVVSGDAEASRLLNDWWQVSEMYLDADDVELCTLVTGEAFVIAWPGEEDGRLEAYYNDSRLCQAFYEDENPRRMSWAAKWWEEAPQTGLEKRTRLTLYYADRLEYYVAEKKIAEVSEGTTFAPLLLDEDDEGSYVAENPLGRVPVFHFRRERRAIKSELGPSVLDSQDAVNKLFNDMMVAAEYSAFRQRYVISNADVGQLRNAPDEIWDIPAGDGFGQGTQVGEFGETQLTNFLSAIKDLAGSIARITKTPVSYFFLGERADPSGEALIAMEAPLNNKVTMYTARLAATWAALAGFVAEVEKIALADGAKPYAVYENPRTVQPFTQAQTRHVNVQAGVPLTTQLRREGWTPRELEEMRADRAEEGAAQASTLAQALLNQQRALDQDDEGDAANG